MWHFLFIYFFFFDLQTYAGMNQLNCFIEVVPMIGHDVCEKWPYNYYFKFLFSAA